MTGQTIGYARVSAADQNPQLQLDALKAAGCDRVFVEKMTGTLRERPQLAAALAYLRPGDVLVVWKLDRLGRSLLHLIEVVTGLRERGVDFRSLKENIDTTTATGRLIFHILAALAEFERDMIRERAAAGRAAAQAQGKTGGRPRSMDADKLAAAKALLATKRTVAQAAKSIGVSRATLYRYLTESVAEVTDVLADETEVSDAGFEMPEWLSGVDQPAPSQK
jgi:DNA invertase Pin-like site-specific DNA recombinase